MKYKLTIAAWFSHFFENAFVSRVNRRVGIRIVRFCRSTQDVEVCFGSGSPLTGVSDAVEESLEASSFGRAALWFHERRPDIG
jgi:hypothetical protein